MKRYFRSGITRLRPGDGPQKLSVSGNYFRIISCSRPVRCTFGGVAGHEITLYQGMGLPFGDEVFNEVWMDPGDITEPLRVEYYWGFGEIHDNRAVAEINATLAGATVAHPAPVQTRFVPHIRHEVIDGKHVWTEEPGTGATYDLSDAFSDGAAVHNAICIALANPRVIRRRVRFVGAVPAAIAGMRVSPFDGLAFANIPAMLVSTDPGSVLNLGAAKVILNLSVRFSAWESVDMLYPGVPTGEGESFETAGAEFAGGGAIFIPAPLAGLSAVLQVEETFVPGAIGLPDAFTAPFPARQPAPWTRNL